MGEMFLKDGLDTMRDDISHSKKPTTMYHTEVECRNELGEVLFKKSNTILLGGRRFTLEKLFNVTSTAGRKTLNQILGIDSGTEVEENGPKKEKCICLFGVGCGGSALQLGSIAKPSASETNLYDLVPMRYVQSGDVEAIKGKGQYYMRKTVDNMYTAFYLKTFEGVSIKLQANGIDYVPSDENIPSYGDSNATYEVVDDVDSYIELTLKLNTDDVREYFSVVKEDTTPHINELGLFLGYYDSSDQDYKEVEAFSKLTFNNEPLDSESKELNIIYRIYI